MQGYESILLVFLLAGSVRLGADRLDRQRIRAYVEARGGQVQRIQWRPFGRGWFGERNARIYAVELVDAQGVSHTATCKTSLGAGVYWTDTGPQGII